MTPPEPSQAKRLELMNKAHHAPSRPRAFAATILVLLAAAQLLGCPSNPGAPAAASTASAASPLPAAATGDAALAPSVSAAIVHEPGSVPPLPSSHPAPSAHPTEPPGAPPLFSRLAALAKSRKAEQTPRSAGFTGRGATLAIPDARGVDFIDPQKGTGFSITTHASVTRYAMSADESLVAVADDTGRTTLWDVPKGSLRRTWPAAGETMVLAANGAKLAMAGPALVVWDTTTGSETLRVEETSAFGMAFGANGKELVATTNNIMVSAYDLTSGAKLSEGGAQTGGTFGIVVSPDGRWAAASAPDGHGMQVFDVHAWGPRQLVVINACSEHIFPRFSQSGRFVFAFAGSLWVKGFEAGTWKPYASYRAPAGRELASAADDLSRVVVTKEQRAPVVITVETKAETKLDGAFEEPASYEISANGLFVAAVLADIARVWSAKTGRLVYEVHP
jgi:hypothetical protein